MFNKFFKDMGLEKYQNEQKDYQRLREVLFGGINHS